MTSPDPDVRVDRYLARIGLSRRPEATIEGLREVHRAHVSQVPYDNLSTFLGRPDPIDAPASVGRVVAESHRFRSTAPESPFLRVVVAQRIDGPVQRGVRGLVHQAMTPDGREQQDLTSYDDWRSALVDDLLLPMDDVTPEEWESLWDRTLTAHRAWDAVGRP